MPAVPEQVSGIKIETFYNTKRPNIPFSEEFTTSSGGTTKFHYVIIYGGEINSLTAAVVDTGAGGLWAQAIDKFIEHYVPAFYMFVNGTATAAQTIAVGSQYSDLRDNILNLMGVQNLRKSAVPPPLSSRVSLLFIINLACYFLQPLI